MLKRQLRPTANKLQHRRAGVAPLEAVMVLPIVILMATTAMLVTKSVCVLVHSVINTTVTWPYM